VRIGDAGDELIYLRLGDCWYDYMNYYPYGEEITWTGNDTFKFAQLYRDSDSGLDYAVNRYYASGIGRFLTVDPSGGGSRPGSPQGWNRYAYTRGNPVTRRDPSGLDDDDVEMEEDIPMFSIEVDDDWDPEPPLDPCVLAPETCLEPIVLNPVQPTEPTVPAFKCPPQYQAWINAHDKDALAAGLPEANALALTSIESSWGGGTFAKDGNDFFNLETCWADDTPKPAPKYKYQVGWITAGKSSDSCGKGPHHALVATYNSSSDSFKSAAATFANLTVNDPATFAQNAAKDRINAGSDPNFLQMQQTFAKCLGHQ
jgi:RHS repeat-associated protein